MAQLMDERLCTSERTSSTTPSLTSPAFTRPHASARVLTTTLPGLPVGEIISLVPSAVLCVLTWTRSGTFHDAAICAMRAALRRIMLRSRMRAGVGRAERGRPW